MRASRHPTILNECDKKLSVVYLLSSSVCTATSGLITPHPTLVKPNTRIPYLVYFQSPVSSKLSLSGPTSTFLYMSCDSFIARYKRTNPTRIPWVYFRGIVLHCTRMDVELVLKTLVNVGGLLGPDKYNNKNQPHLHLMITECPWAKFQGTLRGDVHFESVDEILRFELCRKELLICTFPWWSIV